MSVALEKPTLKRKALPAETDISTTQTPTRDADLFSRFLALPVPVVLLTLWVAGAALMGSCALTLYHLLGLLLSASGRPEASIEPRIPEYQFPRRTLISNSLNKRSSALIPPVPYRCAGVRMQVSEKTTLLGSAVNRGSPSL